MTEDQIGRKKVIFTLLLSLDFKHCLHILPYSILMSSTGIKLTLGSL
jgi:hypothetical protein